MLGESRSCEIENCPDREPAKERERYRLSEDAFELRRTIPLIMSAEIGTARFESQGNDWFQKADESPTDCIQAESRGTQKARNQDLGDYIEAACHHAACQADAYPSAEDLGISGHPHLSGNAIVQVFDVSIFDTKFTIRVPDGRISVVSCAMRNNLQCSTFKHRGHLLA